MFRKPSGDLGFSWSLLANNAFPPLANGSRTDPGHISLPQRDMVYLYQLTSSPSDPTPFDAGTLQASGILSSSSSDTSKSRKAFQALQKTGVCDARGNVDTTKIGPRFTHDLAIIDVMRQKQIVDLLFWWEEECQRLRKLMGEKEELEALVGVAREEVSVDGEGDGRKERLDRLLPLLERVKMKIGMKPSERREDLEADRDELMLRLGGGDAAVAHASGTSLPVAAAGGEQLPAYHA